MAYERKQGTGSSFKNEKKKENPKAPDYTGYFIAHRDIKQGEEIPLAQWVTKSKAGMSYLSNKISDKMVGSEPVAVPVPAPVIEDDALPF
jgi:uncharacterized protein (DUF736 family)